jgi:hypothetical protein
MTQCSELSVDELLSDPIVHALMASDRVDPRELQQLLRSIKVRRTRVSGTRP